ncbi:acetolactate synthase small subunit [Anaerolineales bacterium HSG6]|nr:acetolactate synthase small subunit [Anaerolineales bacterium HSG6]MDM8531357.1 acetolactate synthase small subunit [Anaerolineales bacterium HSG25]
MKQTLVALVEDKPGVLNRVASLFRRRNFNIESLAVGHSETPGVSRMTIVTDEEEYLRRNIVRTNLLKMVNVIDVQDVTDVPSVIRETALIKVRIDATKRREVMDLAEMYRGRIVDVANHSLIVEVTGESSKIDSMLEVLEPIGIVEVMRTGKIAMCRGMVTSRDENGTS